MVKFFRTILRKWRNYVVMRGREFHIVVLKPCDSDREVGRKLFGA